jgi:uncharacterized membrane protein YeiH
MLTELEDFGTVVFAVSGALRAREHRLDPFGVIVIAAVTALGGGTIRDLLLGGGAVSWVHHPIPLLLAFGGGLVTVFTPMSWARGERLLLVADAVGLATFAVVGARIAHSAGATPLAVVVIGTVTAIAGGMLRDVLCGSVPLVLREDIYATAALAGAALYLGLANLGVETTPALFAGGALALIARLAAIRFGLQLPYPRWLGQETATAGTSDEEPAS